MNISNLPNGVTIFAPSQMHFDIRQQLISDNVGKVGIHITTPSNHFAHPTKRIEPLHVYEKYKMILKAYYTNQNPSGIYRNTYDSLPFLKQCYQFVESMKMYEVTSKDFKENNKNEELVEILGLLEGVELQVDGTLRNLWRTEDVSNIYIVDTLYSGVDACIVEALKAKGATMLSQDVGPLNHLHVFLNKRQELEGIAQIILQNNIKADDCAILLCDQSYESTLQRVFSAHHIPFTLLQKREPSKLASFFSIALKFYETKTHEAALELLEHPWVYIPYKKQYLSYMQMQETTYHEDIQLQSLDAFTSSIVDRRDLNAFSYTQQKAKEAKQSFMEFLQPLFVDFDVKQAFQTVSDFILPYAKRYDLQSELFALYELLHTYKHMQEMDDFTFLYETLETMTSKPKQTRSGALVSTLQKPLLSKEYVFICGATQANFPNFKPLKGIFNEKFVEHTSYPSLQDRFQAHEQRIFQTTFTGSYNYATYAVGDYSGKPYESSLELESYAAIQNITPQAYPVIERYIPFALKETITKQTAQDLYVQNGLHGSVSSFERYARCPFSYFMYYGLRLRKNADLSKFSPNITGNLYHQILEERVNLHGENYADIREDELRASIQEKLQVLQTLFPKKGAEYSLLEKRVLRSLTSSLTFLNDLQKDSLFHSIVSEQPFPSEGQSFEIQTDVGPIYLHGFIDRKDKMGRKVVIMDYKSSAHKLEKKVIAKGVQLQLLTYALACETLWGEEVVGTFYISLKEESIKQIASKVERKKNEVTYFGRNTDFDKVVSSRKLNGMIMDSSIVDFDPSCTHVHHLKMNKGGPKATITTMPEIKEWLVTLYNSLATSMLDGDISITPTQGACKFCEYRSICGHIGDDVYVKDRLEFEEKEEA